MRKFFTERAYAMVFNVMILMGIKLVQPSLSPAGQYMLFFSGDEKNGDKKV